MSEVTLIERPAGDHEASDPRPRPVTLLGQSWGHCARVSRLGSTLVFNDIDLAGWAGADLEIDLATGLVRVVRWDDTSVTFAELGRLAFHPTA
jgi:hypothetical protein